MQSTTPGKSQKPIDTADNTDEAAAGDCAAASTASTSVSDNAKILPPTSPVDVPRMPHPVPESAAVPDLSDPRGNTTSWADSPEADPHKKTARTSINNG
jgi:hypothetical protein